MLATSAAPLADCRRADTSEASGGLATASSPQPNELGGIVHILTCGSVDDGKSTLIGRLLWDAEAIPDDTRATLLASAGPDGLPDLSGLVDGLAAEREQGITIDIAWRYFDTATRRHVIIDSPGHEQYTRNMACGASHADVAIMLVDVRHGIKRQTRRHAAILHLVGLRHVILAVNKMDLVDWSEARFRSIESDFAAISRQFGFESAVCIPLAARPGDNVVKRSAHMPWYSGPTLLKIIDRAPGRRQTDFGGFRLPVQTVLRDDADLRGLAGTISSGHIRIGDPIIDCASGRQASVRRILSMDGEQVKARTGNAVVIELDQDLDISRGALLACPQTAPRPARRLEVRLVWLADTPLATSNGLLLRLGTDLVPVCGIEVARRLDLDSLREVESDQCAAGDIAVAALTLARPLAADRFDANPETGSFVVVDALTGATLAGGTVVNVSEGDDAATSGFVLSEDILARGLCRDVASGTAEFRRRAEEVAILLRAAGVPASLALDHDNRVSNAGHRPTTSLACDGA